MGQVTIRNIHKRLYGLQKPNSTRYQNNSIFIESVCLSASSKRLSDIKSAIGSAVKNNNIPFNIISELFESLIYKGSESDIINYGSIIYENSIPKVRDAKSTQSLIKGRISRLQSKTKPKDSIGLNNHKEEKKQKSNTEAVISEYKKMLEGLDVYINCDRVLENYNKISKRFNLDLLFNENTMKNGVEDTVTELCNMIDTYTMPTAIKFNTVIETAWYGFESNSIKYKKSDILETALDYFLFKEDGLNSCRDILDATLFYDKNEDMGNIDIIMEEEPENDNIDPYGEINTYIINKNNFSNNKNIVKENTDFNEIFKKFKENELGKDNKPESKLKSLVLSLYKKDVNSIVDGTPDLLSWIRRFFIIGSGAVPVIGPVLMIIVFISDKFISLHMDRSEVSKMIKCFENEIKISRKKLETISNKDDKDRLSKYIDSLEKAKEKIDSYYNDLLTDDEMSAKYDQMFNDSDDDDEYDDLLEFNIMNEMSNSIERILSIIENRYISNRDMYDIASYIDNDDLNNAAIIVNKYPEIFHKESLIDGINDNINDIRKNNILFESALSKSLRFSTLSNALDILKSDIKNNDHITIYEAYNQLISIEEAYTAFNIICNVSKQPNLLVEASIVNNLKMASMKLRNAITKMTDKQKSVSKSIDVGLNNLSKSVERSLTNDNRESIIKGSVLPSASKLIKLGIVNAGLIAIGQPILAAITTLGYLGVSSKFKAKERQMLIDEIEIELKMCQKYIDIAEQKNDMKALKQLLMIQRDLERQHQRIKYKMKAELGQKYYDAKHVDG